MAIGAGLFKKKHAAPKPPPDGLLMGQLKISYKEALDRLRNAGVDLPPDPAWRFEPVITRTPIRFADLGAPDALQDTALLQACTDTVCAHNGLIRKLEREDPAVLAKNKTIRRAIEAMRNANISPAGWAHWRFAHWREARKSAHQWPSFSFLFAPELIADVASGYEYDRWQASSYVCWPVSYKRLQALYQETLRLLVTLARRHEGVPLDEAHAIIARTLSPALYEAHAAQVTKDLVTTRQRVDAAWRAGAVFYSEVA